MPIGTEVDLGPGHIVLDGAQLLLPERGTASALFSAHVYCGQTVAHLSTAELLFKNAFEYYEFTANPHHTILAHSECISSRMYLEYSANIQNAETYNVQNALRMPYECSSIASRITPEVKSESASNAVRTQSGCFRNGCRIRFERPRIQT